MAPLLLAVEDDDSSIGTGDGGSIGTGDGHSSVQIIAPEQMDSEEEGQEDRTGEEKQEGQEEATKLKADAAIEPVREEGTMEGTKEVEDASDKEDEQIEVVSC